MLRVAGADRHLGAKTSLALAHAVGDVGRQGLRLQRLADHDGVDRLVHNLLETRHVNARLARIQVNEALECRVVELLGSGGRDPDDLLDPCYPDSGKADLGCRSARLNVGCVNCYRAVSGGGHPGGRE